MLIVRADHSLMVQPAIMLRMPRAIICTAASFFSVCCYIWSYQWCLRRRQVSIVSITPEKWTPMDLILLGYALTMVALIFCVWSWRAEPRGAAATASAAALPPFALSLWMLLWMTS
jgi:hypothetical protein